MPNETPTETTQSDEIDTGAPDPQSAQYWAIVHFVAGVTGASVDDIAGQTRGDRRAAYARHLVWTLLHAEADREMVQTLALIATHIPRDRSSVSAAIAAIEDDRSDPDVDAGLDEIAGRARQFVELARWMGAALGAAREAVGAEPAPKTSRRPGKG